MSHLHGSNGGAAATGPGLCQSLLVQIGTLGAAGQVGLHLPELGQVEDSDLLERFFGSAKAGKQALQDVTEDEWKKM